MSILNMARKIVEREGGYVNDPDDPGGATNYGVTIHTMRRLKLDLNGDGNITAADVEALTVDGAVEIFVQHYFTGPGIASLPEALHETVFDMYVNAGGNAVKILQRLLGQFQEPVTVDGVIGPMTAAAVKRVHDEAGDYLVDAYAIARRDYYFAIADARPASRKYARTRRGGKGGWIKRAEEFMARRFHMTPSQFKERTAAWG